MNEVVLHGYWRSSAAYRVRIALNLKQVAYRQVSHNLRTGQQRDAGYLAIAPHGLVPALECDGDTLIESPAILEWIETRWPTPALLPVEPFAAATVRAMAALICCDIHPLNNLRVLRKLKHGFDASSDQIDQWVRHWIMEGFAPLERLVERYSGGFCYGDSPTLADCCLIPQIYNARRYAVDMGDFPKLRAIEEKCGELTAFTNAAPEHQADAD